MEAMIRYMGANFTIEDSTSDRNHAPAQRFGPMFHQGTEVEPCDIGLRIIRDQVEKDLRAEQEEKGIFLDGAFDYLAGKRDQGGELLRQFKETYGAAQLRLLFIEFRERLDYLKNQSRTALRSVTKSNRRVLEGQGIPLRDSVYSSLFHVDDNNYYALRRILYALTKDCDAVEGAAIATDSLTRRSTPSKVNFTAFMNAFAGAISRGAYSRPKK